MLRPQGYLTITDDRTIEADTISCGHCGCVVKVKPGTSSTVHILESLHVDPITKRSTIVQKEEQGAFCRVCMQHICLRCHDKGVCSPLMRKIDEMESRGRMWADL